MILSEEECKEIVAGSITGTLINAVTSLVKTIVDIGRSLGSAIRRIASKKSCAI